MIFDIANNKSDIRDLLIFGLSAKNKMHKENQLMAYQDFLHAPA